MRGKNINRSAIGNDFIAPKPRLQPAMQLSVPSPIPSLGLPNLTLDPPRPSNKHSQRKPSRNSLLDVIHEHSVIVFALLLLIIGVAVIEFGSSYIMAHDYPPLPNNNLKAFPAIGGLNKTVSSANLTSFISSVTNQPASLNLGNKTVSISPDTIKSWLTITGSGTNSYIHVDAGNVASSLNNLINQYVVAPVNQVTITRSDGSSEVAIAGQNGTGLDPNAGIAAQAVTIAKNLFNTKGFNVNAPLVSLPFQALTPAAFPKLIVVDLNSKKLYMFQNGQLINTVLVSAGKPSTPSPVGEFHIWVKLQSQTMTGPGYVQPNVPWVNYFDHNGDAIHGVYWRPAYVFGSVNTSHGCVGVPLSSAAMIYNWAPIGTPVITTPN